MIRISLWVTAPFNLAVGYALAFPASSLSSVMGLPPQPPSYYTLFTGGLVALFGCVYFWLARQDALNGPVLFIGASGKLLAVTIAWIAFAAGQFPLLTALLISGDLIFVALWFLFLSKRPQQPA
jgi:hypothetical protein